MQTPHTWIDITQMTSETSPDISHTPLDNIGGKKCQQTPTDAKRGQQALSNTLKQHFGVSGGV